MTAVALTLPSASFATSLAEVGTNGEALAASASTVMDKFAATGLLAMKTSRFVSLVGSVGALAVMTVISVLIGQIFHAVPA
eukprot:5933631-Ditylum_brightwellii.AAC.1